MARIASFVTVTCGLVALVGQAGLEGCLFHSCTEAGCAEALEVEIRYADESLIPGEYRFEFDVGGNSHSCSMTLPDPEARSQLCGGGSLSRSQAGGPLLLVIYNEPAIVVVTVSRDGSDVGTVTWSPSYRVTHPNGPDCDPTCRSATAAIRLPDGDGDVELEAP